MGAVRGRYTGGKVILDAPADWPEGAEVAVERADRAEKAGLSEDEWDDSPEGIAAWIAWYDALEPLVLTAEDEQRIRRAREESPGGSPSWTGRNPG